MTVDTTPTAANRLTWRQRPGGRVPATDARGDVATGSRPDASPRRTRTTPRRSSSAVATTSTRESGSSNQSTGTSWIRSPERWASTSSSVSKNQVGSSTIGSSSAATSARIALNPHCASVNRAPSAPFRTRL